MSVVKFLSGLSIKGTVTNIDASFTTVYFVELKKAVSYANATISCIEWDEEELRREEGV